MILSAVEELKNSSIAVTLDFELALFRLDSKVEMLSNSNARSGGCYNATNKQQQIHHGALSVS